MREAHLRSWLLPLASTASDSTMPPKHHPCHPCPIPQSSLYTTLSRPACFLSHHPSCLSQGPASSHHTHLWRPGFLLCTFFSIYHSVAHAAPCQPSHGFLVMGVTRAMVLTARCSPLPRTSQYFGTKNVLSVIHCLDDFPKLLNCPSQVQCSWKMPRKSTFET